MVRGDLSSGRNRIATGSRREVRDDGRFNVDARFHATDRSTDFAR